MHGKTTIKEEKRKNLTVVKCECVEWIHLAQYVVQKLELVNKKIRLQALHKADNILTN